MLNNQLATFTGVHNRDKAAHFAAGKDFVPACISHRRIERKLELGNYFVEAKDHVFTGNS